MLKAALERHKAQIPKDLQGSDKQKRTVEDLLKDPTMPVQVTKRGKPVIGSTPKSIEAEVAKLKAGMQK